MVVHFLRVPFFIEFLYSTSIPLPRATHQEIPLPKEGEVTNHICLPAQGFLSSFLLGVEKEGTGAWGSRHRRVRESKQEEETTEILR